MQEQFDKYTGNLMIKEDAILGNPNSRIFDEGATFLKTEGGYELIEHGTYEPGLTLVGSVFNHERDPRIEVARFHVANLRKVTVRKRTRV